MDDEDRDFERYGGPIAPGHLMTLLRACLRDEYDTLVPHDAFDVEKMAREINSWMTLVGDVAAAAADVQHVTKQ